MTYSERYSEKHGSDPECAKRDIIEGVELHDPYSLVPKMRFVDKILAVGLKNHVEVLFPARKYMLNPQPKYPEQFFDYADLVQFIDRLKYFNSEIIGIEPWHQDTGILDPYSVEIHEISPADQYNPHIFFNPCVTVPDKVLMDFGFLKI